MRRQEACWWLDQEFGATKEYSYKNKGKMKNNVWRIKSKSTMHVKESESQVEMTGHRCNIWSQRLRSTNMFISPYQNVRQLQFKTYVGLFLNL